MWIKNWFTNMAEMDEPFIYQGISYKTSENYYQAMKMPKDRIDLRAELAALNPYKCKTSIRNKKKYPWREDWTKEMSLEVMEKILHFKFQAHTSWGKRLIATGDEDIVEWNNWNDKF